MEFEQADRRFRELQAQVDQGTIDPDTFRVEAAKLLCRDRDGTFWLPEAESGAWYCNRGEGWVRADPAESHFEGGPDRAGAHAARRLLLAAILVFTLSAAALLVWRSRPVLPWSRSPATATAPAPVQVTIASPANGAVVPLGQQVGIEATLSARPDLQAVARAELYVGPAQIGEQTVSTRLKPGQASLPLSLPWRPAAVGQYQVRVVALGAAGETLGQASIDLRVAEVREESVPKPACTLQATFLSDVTIPPGTTFAPEARMGKVWQVRNSGTCAWGLGYELDLVSGESLSAPGPVRVPPTAAGEAANLEVIFWAPRAAGHYTGTWQLRSPQGEIFGPLLGMDVQVRVQAEQRVPPRAPANVQVALAAEGKGVRLSWDDRSDDEDAFRVYREDVEASVGLVPANAVLFVDRAAACGNSYRYGVAAFNAAGASDLVQAAEITLPPCAGDVEPPTLLLTIVPGQVMAGEVFTVVFGAEDEAAVTQVLIRGQDTGDLLLDAGRSFACADRRCTGAWAVTWTGEVSTTLTFVAVARDRSGLRSNTAQAQILIRPRP